MAERGTRTWGALLAAATLLAFLPALRAGYIIDDAATVTENPLLRTPGGLARIWSDPGANPHEVHYWPLVYTTFWLEHRAWGARPFGYHLVNVLLHVANALLLWRVLSRLEVRGTGLAAAVFALHPVHVESVAWITERKDVLSGFFSLLAFLAYLRFDRTRARRFWALALVLLVCAMLSKSVAVTLPLAVLIALWWKGGRLAWRDVSPALVLLLAAAAIALADLLVMRARSPGGYDLSSVERGLVAGRALWFYLGRLVWPSPLMLFYPRWEIDAGAPAQYAFPLGAAAVAAALFLGRRRIGRGPLAATLLFAVTLAPALGFVDFAYMGTSWVADRFQYLASAGPIALFAAIAGDALRRLGAGRRARRVAAAALLLVLGATTWRQAGVYRDEETILRDTLAKNPGAWVAHLNLGKIHKDRGELDDARRHYEEALRLRPSFDYALNNLGILLAGERRHAEATRHFERAIEANPRYAAAYLNLGQVQTKLGRFDEAVTNLTRARELDPADARTRQELGNALLMKGEVAAAVAEYRAALERDPARLEAAYHLAWTLATHARAPAADPEEAVRLARQACRLAANPNPLTLDALAAALARAGRHDEAAAAAGEAVAIARAAGLEPIAARIEERLALYRAGRAWREETSSLRP